MRGMVLVVVMLGGCAGFPTSGLEGPAERCMQSPSPPPQLTAGVDLVQVYAKLLRSYVDATSRLKCVQRYVNRVTK